MIAPSGAISAFIPVSHQNSANRPKLAASQQEGCNTPPEFIADSFSANAQNQACKNLSRPADDATRLMSPVDHASLSMLGLGGMILPLQTCSDELNPLPCLADNLGHRRRTIIFAHHYASEFCAKCLTAIPKRSINQLNLRLNIEIFNSLFYSR